MVYNACIFLKRYLVDNEHSLHIQYTAYLHTYIPYIAIVKDQDKRSRVAAQIK